MSLQVNEFFHKQRSVRGASREGSSAGAWCVPKGNRTKRLHIGCRLAGAASRCTQWPIITSAVLLQGLLGPAARTTVRRRSVTASRHPLLRLEMIASGVTTAHSRLGPRRAEAGRGGSQRGHTGLSRHRHARLLFACGTKPESPSLSARRGLHCEPAVRVAGADGSLVQPYQYVRLRLCCAVRGALRPAPEEPAGQDPARTGQSALLGRHVAAAVGSLAQIQCAIAHALLETACQKEYARRRGDCTAVDHIGRFGLIGPQMTLGHGVWLNEKDIERLAETGTCVCHNCSSSFRLRSGVAALNRLEAEGINPPWRRSSIAVDADATFPPAFLTTGFWQSSPPTTASRTGSTSSLPKWSRRSSRISLRLWI
jgi:hypothetical protein